jgi:hypothetical protein
MSGHTYGRGSIAARLFYLETTLRAAREELAELKARALGKLCPGCNTTMELTPHFGLIRLANGKTRRQYLCKDCRARRARASRAAARATPLPS